MKIYRINTVVFSVILFLTPIINGYSPLPKRRKLGLSITNQPETEYLQLTQSVETAQQQHNEVQVQEREEEIFQDRNPRLPPVEDTRG